MANRDLAPGALVKPSRLDRDVRKRQKLLAKRATKRASEKVEVAEWRAICEAIFKRDQGVCRVCGRRVKPLTDDPTKRAHTHHIHYRSAGGGDESANLLLLCGLCHSIEHTHGIDIMGNGDTTVTIYKMNEAGKEIRRESPCPSETRGQ